MGDYRLETKVKNNRIYKHIVRLGFDSVAEFCRTHNLNQGPVGDYINMKNSPIGAKGQWKQIPLKLAEIFSVEPEDLFTPNQMIGLKHEESNLFVHELEESDMLLILDNGVNQQRLIEEKEMTERIDDVLSTLTPREELVIRKRFGFDGDEMTFSEIGKELNITQERIRQIEKKALRKIRHPSRSLSIA